MAKSNLLDIVVLAAKSNRLEIAAMAANSNHNVEVWKQS